jgi:hypothetical protein
MNQLVNLLQATIQQRSTSILLLTVEVEVVSNLLISLNPSTGMGHDDLSARLLKELAQAISPNVANIFNCCIENNIYPSTWKKANISSVWKNKGIKSEPSNYRPISVLSWVDYWRNFVQLN